MGVILLYAGLSFLLIAVFVWEERLGLSWAEITVDNVRSAMIESIERKGRKDKAEIIGQKVEDIFKIAVQVGLLAGGIITITMLIVFKLGILSVVFILLGAAGSVIIAKITIETNFKKWQDKMVDGFATGVVEFLPSFLETPSITTRAALEYTIPFLKEPLRSEMAKTVWEIQRTGNAKKELVDMSDRVKHHLVRAICYRLSATWDTSIDPSLFQDIQQGVNNVREMAAAKVTAKKKVMFAGVAALGLFGLLLLIGIPLIIKMGGQMASGFGIGG